MMMIMMMIMMMMMMILGLLCITIGSCTPLSLVREENNNKIIVLR